MKVMKRVMNNFNNIVGLNKVYIIVMLNTEEKLNNILEVIKCKIQVKN